MGKVLIVYASMSGNTKIMAKYIAEGVKEEGFEVDMKDANITTSEEILKYDGILLGCYSYDGIPDEFLDFYDGLPFIDVRQKKVAVFGSGDSMYDVFCIAVDQIVEQLHELGADVVLDGLKVELTPLDSDADRCIEFGKEFVKKLM